MDPQTLSQSTINDPPSIPQPRRSFLLPALLVLLVLLLSSTAFLAWQNMQLQKQIASLSIDPGLKPEPVPIDPTTNWSTYRDTILGIEYQLPPHLTPLNLNNKESPGDTGTQYCLTYTGSVSKLIHPVFAGSGPCDGATFGIGAVSKDYIAGREGGFSDYVGYVQKDKAFYPVFIRSPGSTPLPVDLVSERTNTHGVTYLRIRGGNSLRNVAGEQMMEIIPGTPGEGYLGALINLQNSRYAGFNIQMRERQTSADAMVFDQILSTFKFIEPSLTTLIPADSQTPAAGVCGAAQGASASITLNIDTPNPRCIKASSNQKLTLINGTNGIVNLNYFSYQSQIAPGSSYTFPKTIGEFLEPGVHVIKTSLYGGGGPEIWLQ